MSLDWIIKDEDPPGFKKLYINDDIGNSFTVNEFFLFMQKEKAQH